MFQHSTHNKTNPPLQVVPQIVAQLPKYLRSTTVDVKVDLGHSPPKLLGVRGRPRYIPASNQTNLDFFIGLESDLAESEISITLGRVTISIKHLLFRGDLILTFDNIFDEPPFFSGLSLYFSTPPEVKFKFGKNLGLLQAVNLYSIVDWDGNGVGLSCIGPVSDAGFKSVSDQCQVPYLHSPCHSVSIVPCRVHVIMFCGTSAECPFTDRRTQS